MILISVKIYGVIIILMKLALVKTVIDCRKGLSQITHCVLYVLEKVLFQQCLYINSFAICVP
jgi:hypothetical protein